ncbi:hypothetical protein ACI8AV_10240 [Geodermatophilus sp. SYSU D00804]
MTPPTGDVGPRLTRLLVQAGVRPRVLPRDPARLDGGLRDHGDAVPADLTDRDAVLRAPGGAAALDRVCPPTGAGDPAAALGEAQAPSSPG